MFPNRHGAWRGRGYRQINMVHLAALQALLQYAALPRKPVVTTALIAANVAAYYKPGPLWYLLPATGEVCLNPRDVLQNFDWKRLILSAFYHSGDAHLIYNMISLLWKGYQLESKLGSFKFGRLVAILLVASHSTLVAVSTLLAVFTGWTSPYRHHCAVGFSAVLFAMKTVLNSYESNYTSMYGMFIPSRYASWAELFLIQIFVPEASFLGHLCGILAGHVYLNVGRAISVTSFSYNGLRRVLRGILVPFGLGSVRGQGRMTGQDGGRARRRESERERRDTRDRSQPDRSGRASSERRGTDSSSSVWRCVACTYDNPSSINKCEMCETPRRRDPGPSSDANTSAPPSSGWSFDDYIPSQTDSHGPSWTDQPPVGEMPVRHSENLDDIRRMRLERFRR